MADLRNEFSWSKSRGEVFAECPRKYFYSYYGAWGGWSAKPNSRERTLYVLKQLMTRQMWAGTLVHNCLRWILTSLRTTGNAPSEEAALSALGKRLQVDFQNSGEGLYWENPKKIPGLLEHEYDHLEVEDEVWARVFQRALEAVTTFYHSEIFQTLHSLHPDDWMEIERLGHFEVDGVKVWVQLDCAFHIREGLQVIDWKTGRADLEQTRAQLALYAWYASQTWNLDPATVFPSEINLRTGETIAHQFTESDFERIRQTIAQSVAAMRALLDDVDLNLATEDRFPMSESDDPCHTCAFRRVCPKWATPAGAHADE
ncbi:MAG: PD-(D/E)XK nuclease family protein [Kiritimatiellae bacterium]|nr:PD-(D/E)XK nuclease family protein [Kiritimatiellia bacterium]MCO5069546.1 PD-(D/E)XK nuclease family protein [Kiritimatiellia bacterium]